MSIVLQELNKYAGKLVESGLVVGAGGNLSARDGNVMYISPSGFDLQELTDDLWVKVEIESGKVLSDLKPSSELEMQDRKSTRLNSSHVAISYAVFCLQ